LIAIRYERRSLIVTANHPFGEWMRIPAQGGQVFRSDPGHCSDLMAATIPI
jgi:hypothetical protein